MIPQYKCQKHWKKEKRPRKHNHNYNYNYDYDRDSRSINRHRSYNIDYIVEIDRKTTIKMITEITIEMIIGMTIEMTIDMTTEMTVEKKIIGISKTRNIRESMKIIMKTHMKTWRQVQR